MNKRLLLPVVTVSILSVSCNSEMASITDSKEVFTTTRSVAPFNFIECATPAPAPPSWIFEGTSLQNINQIENKTFGVNIIVVKTSTGDYLEPTTVASNIIANLNEYYRDSKIQFSCISSKRIETDNYRYKNINDLFNTYKNNYALNIFVFNNDDYLLPAAGIAQSIPSTSCAISKSYYKTVVPSHEIGHCLGLYHTHHGTSVMERDNTTIPELVNGSNSSFAGDYIVDTPADPCEWVSTGDACQYSMSYKDSNNQTYKPDPHNIMSYANKICLEYFTEKQIERMHDFVNRTSSLQNAYAIKISGPSHFCNRGEYELDTKRTDIKNIEWNLITDKTNRNTGSTTSIHSKTNNKVLEIEDYDSSYDNLYEISAKVELNSGYIYQINTVKATSKQTSPFNGQIYWNCGNFHNQNTNSNGSTATLEIEAGQTLKFELLNYCDNAGNNLEKPSIETYAVDLQSYSRGNISEITASDVCGEGTLEVSVGNECTKEGTPFLIPYIVFDVDNLSLVVDDNLLRIIDKKRVLRQKNLMNITVMDCNKNIVIEKKSVSDSQPVDISSLDKGKYYLKIERDSHIYYKKLTLG